MVQAIGSSWRRWIVRGLVWSAVGVTLIVVGYVARGVGPLAIAVWPETRLHAATAAQNDVYAMATGFIDDEIEGVYLLNFLTGDLQCSVVSNRPPSMGKFIGLFKTNVIRDLGLDPSKQPAYLMVTGQATFSRGGGAAQPAMSAVYVLDTSSGRFAAYSLPWRRDMASTGRPQIGMLTLLDVAQGPAAVQRD